MFWTLVFTVVCAYYIWDWYQSKKRVSGINKKCVFITGCDSGFGNALARRLDVLGVPVFAGCLTEKGATELKEKASERLQTVLVDVANHDSIVQAYEFVRNNVPDDAELWGIVNNAGIGGDGGPLEYMTRKSFNDVYEVNLIGVIDVTQTFLPLLKKSEGRIVNTASSAALVHIPEFLPYVTAKHAVRAFSGCLRHEKQPYGIKVSCVLPGAFKTPITNKETLYERTTKQWNDLPQEVKETIGEEYHSKKIEVAAKSMSFFSADLTPVIDAYEHALLAQKPRDEYFPGKDATFIRYLSMLPGPIVNFLFRMFVLRASGFDVLLPKDLINKRNNKQ